MEIYVEYALAENFLLDGMLLWLAMKASRSSAPTRRIVLSAAAGAVFAVVFPLLRVGNALAYILRFAAGILLCLIANKEKRRGRVAMSVIFFFAFSFALGGMLIAVFSVFSLDYRIAGDGYLASDVPVGGALGGAFAFALLSSKLIGRIVRGRSLRRFVYPCEVTKGERRIKADGFLDSGNRARVKGRPVCFLTPDLAYDLLGDAEMTEEMTILTMAGEKKIKIFLADKVEIYCGDEPNIIKQVYFSPTANIRAREYKIVFNVALTEE